MELTKIKESINELIIKANANTERAKQNLKDTKAKLSLVEVQLNEAMAKGDEEKNEKLIKDKRELEDKIKFFEDYLTKQTSAPVLTIEDANKSYQELLANFKAKDFEKKYKEIVDNLFKLNTEANELLNYFFEVNEIANKLNDFAKTNNYGVDFAHSNQLKDIVNNLRPLILRRNTY